LCKIAHNARVCKILLKIHSVRGTSEKGAFMRLRTPRDIGALVRDTRRTAGVTQEGLAERARVSRRWIVDLEAGKPGVELGKVLRVLGVLDIDLDAVAGHSPDRTSLDLHLENYHRGVS
jgi:HTH-type transcriptional regulator/antitoxin HipB